MSETAAIPGNAGRNDYPRMIYHTDGRSMVVASPEEEDKLRADGWGQRPSATHLQRAATHAPALVPDPLAATLRAVLEAVLDERGITRTQPAGGAQETLHPHHRRKE